MMKFVALFGILICVSACTSKVPSEVISNTVINELQSHSQAISLLEKQTKPECKTDAFIANLNAIKSQTENLVEQVKSISQSCKIEKKEIENRVYIRDCFIVILLLIIAFFVYIRIKR